VTASHSPALLGLPPLLRDEPALTTALGSTSARLAITEVARPISIAALSHLSERAPLIVACPTGTDAARLHDDLVQFLGRDDCLLFPAWETLPFERVSPAVETMGRRMEVLWRLTTASDRPKSSLPAFALSCSVSGQAHERHDRFTLLQAVKLTPRNSPRNS
jgi:transcription-repair coupling factor (superfamily II helicase)